MLSTVSINLLDADLSQFIPDLGRRVINGARISREEALRLFHIKSQADIYLLLAWANRIREHFHGNKIHLCSIVNIKAGGCPENCKFCAQSGFYETSSPRYSLIDKDAVLEAAEEARQNHVTGLGIVAAWRGLEEGPVLDDICECLEAMRSDGNARPDASLGIIRSQAVADRLKAAGCECYNHNLESSARFYSEVCSTHTYEDRVQTIEHLKRAGISICSGGIIGMGETLEDRCDLALALRDLDVDFVPINILNPVEGTPLGKVSALTPMQALHSIACFRFILPRQQIMVAGGRVVNLRDIQSMVFMAGASALMVGNYLTTVNQPVEKDLQMLKDLGLEPLWGHGSSKSRPLRTTSSRPSPSKSPHAAADS